MPLPQAIGAAYQRLGMTWEQFAAEAGTTRWSVQAWARGSRHPQPQQVPKLLEVIARANIEVDRDSLADFGHLGRKKKK